MSDLFTFVFDQDNKLPFLSRDGAASFNLLADGQIYGKLRKNSGVFDNINVIEDFPWTKSPKRSREDVPEIQLVEKRIINNSSLANFFYTLLAGADVAELAGSRIESGNINVAGQDFNVYDTTSNILNSTSITSDLISNPFNTLINGKDGKGGLRNAGQSVANFAKQARETATKYLKQQSEPYVEQYNGLYFTEDTGFRYSMPYLSDSYLESNGNFSSAGSFGEGISDLIGEVSDILLIDKPGTYVEQSKQVDLGENGRTLTFRFPLLNTGTFEELERNWQLIFALVYQNKFGRINRALIEQPCIYEVFMEGVSYMPYAYISNINVNFLGARRKVIVGIPQFKTQAANAIRKPNERRQIETIIPDAYNVEISITGLNPESRNFMIRSLGDPIIKVDERLV